MHIGFWDATGISMAAGIVRTAMGGAACGGSHCGAPAGDAGGPTEEDAAHARLLIGPGARAGAA